MRVSCPNCSTEYDLPDAALGGRSRKLRCANCGQTWYSTPPSIAGSLNGPDTALKPTAPAWPADARPTPAAPEAPLRTWIPHTEPEPRRPAPQHPPQPTVRPAPPQPQQPAAQQAPQPVPRPAVQPMPEPAAQPSPIARRANMEPAPQPVQPPAPPQAPRPAPPQPLPEPAAQQATPPIARRANMEPAPQPVQPQAQQPAAQPVFEAAAEPASRRFGQPVDESAHAEFKQAIRREQAMPTEAAAPLPEPEPEEPIASFVAAELPSSSTALAAYEPQNNVPASFTDLIAAVRNKSIEFEPDAPPIPLVSLSSPPLFYTLLGLFLFALMMMEHRFVIHLLPFTGRMFAAIGLR